jgi:hypothetical protein
MDTDTNTTIDDEHLQTLTSRERATLHNMRALAREYREEQAASHHMRAVSAGLTDLCALVERLVGKQLKMVDLQRYQSLLTIYALYRLTSEATLQEFRKAGTTPGELLVLAKKLEARTFPPCFSLQVEKTLANAQAALGAPDEARAQ